MRGGFVIGRGATRIMFSTSFLSVLGTFTVLVTLLLSGPFRKKQTTIVLFNLFLSQLLTSLGSIVGEPEDDSIACWFEAIVTNIFTLSSLFWAVVIMWLLLKMVFDIQRTVNIWVLAFVCYGIPVIVTMVPFSNATYGAPPPENIGWCWIVETDKTPSWGSSFWYWMNYYGWVWATFILMFILLVPIAVHYLRMRVLKSKALDGLKAAIISLAGYPLSVFIAWFPSACNDFYSYNRPDVEVASWVRKFANALSCLMGFMCTIAFFASPVHRQLLLRHFGQNQKAPSLRNSGIALTDNPSSRAFMVTQDIGSPQTEHGNEDH